MWIEESFRCTGMFQRFRFLHKNVRVSKVSISGRSDIPQHFPYRTWFYMNDRSIAVCGKVGDTITVRYTTNG